MMITYILVFSPGSGLLVGFKNPGACSWSVPLWVPLRPKEMTLRQFRRQVHNSVSLQRQKTKAVPGNRRSQLSFSPSWFWRALALWTLTSEAEALLAFHWLLLNKKTIPFWSSLFPQLINLKEESMFSRCQGVEAQSGWGPPWQESTLFFLRFYILLVNFLYYFKY